MILHGGLPSEYPVSHVLQVVLDLLYGAQPLGMHFLKLLLVTRERIRQIETRAFEKLRDAMVANNASENSDVIEGEVKA